ncbi:MAG: preprotein translocase subunit SecA [Candidatus Peribacter sp.]|nr:preprotein translocase subunit SecA [Candidatus Peribacter sp.]MBT4600917.1 preprotein translocase subunit SecA [Candidatus Peribacter sp.]MBT5148953.1 preprotein translocase subunit SecA [Candidatus Peribacter sp.]MBT5638368.1 preprotein translocase subunit SecA [Candidatus Peribacter sp.]MBT5937929.1 preprotein translocase subunit SecA [Candidatus Peribacter sp.]
MDSLNRLLGDPNEKELKKLRPYIAKVRAEQEKDEYKKLTLEDLPKQSDAFRARLEKGETVDALVPEAFALVARACELLTGTKYKEEGIDFVWEIQNPFDVQIIGGVALHQGNVAEMRTGEGKTFVCTMPIYLNALLGKGVHVVTVNDYLARRDAAWMKVLYEALGLTVGVILHEKNHEERQEAYGCDVTYGTNNEFGFDYLRDNMAVSKDRQVQRGLHYAIVDEVDSILIDEARTPLIISQPAGESTTKYQQYSIYVKELQENVHYNKDEKQKAAVLSEEGIKKMEELLGLENIYTEKGFEEVHHIEQALRASAMYELDTDYVVRDGEVIIVDEFTGRLMPGRRYSHGLHQAIEAKEGVEVQRESKTLATITFQNYFRLYDKLAGMTGTAKTEEEEFESIYKLGTIVIPTNKPVVRADHADAIYRTVEAKFMAVAKMAREMNAKGQPVLIGTTSIEKSEALSSLLTSEKIEHNVLNAKQHEKEAEIVAGAGQQGAITIATNMAGRGTDIKLGDGVKEIGGLAILGTERHESRRIDNQLRGRSGRQGDPGESRFFVSMEDDLMRLFGGDRLKDMMEKLKVPDDVPLENTIVSRSIEGAQKRVEGKNFDIRRHTVQYDDVMNKHREIIYVRRQKILDRLAEVEQEEVQGEQPLHENILESLRNEGSAIVESHARGDDAERWDNKEMSETVATLHPVLGQKFTEQVFAAFPDKETAQQELGEFLVHFYEAKCEEEDAAMVARAERVITLQSIDTRWMDHIDDMSHLREQVAFAGFAQRDPLIEYKDQGFQRFQQLLATVENSIIRMLLQADFAQFAPRAFLQDAQDALDGLQTNEDVIEEGLGQGVGGAAKQSQNPIVMNADDHAAAGTAPLSVDKIGRNDPCPCGSGKKYKKCHG